MERLKRIWNACPASGGESARIKAARALALFFLFMVCCTLVSRAADSLTIPVVTVEKPKRMALSHTLEVEGLLEPADTVPVFAPENALVKDVAVAVGDQVKAGDLLLTYDTREARQQMAQKELELTKLELELDVIEQKAKLADEKNRASLDRAFEDYDAQAEAASLQVKAARDAMNRAKREMREFDWGGEGDLDAAFQALKDSYLEKKQLYEQAGLEEETALSKAGRGIEDAIPEDYTREKELKQADIRAKQLELAALRESMATGSVTAPADGTVTALTAEAGKRLDGAALRLSTGGVQFAAELTEEQRREAVRGGTMTVELSNGKQVKDVAVQILPAAGKSGIFRMVAGLPEGEAGTAATAVLARKTETYDACVPLSAVNGQGVNAYVLVVRESETALGLEYTADKIPVVIQDSNESYAAVSGGLSSEDRVVTDGALSEGSRLRLTEAV